MIVPALHRLIIKQKAFEEFDEDRKKLKELGLELPADTNIRKQASVDVGYVVAVGPTAFRDFGYNDPAEVVKVGDFVSYAKNCGKFVTDPATNEEFLVINDEDLVCVFKE